ncbi:MAG: ABC transporter permease [Chloroflexi bacterium]|nr:ABC transporter permease [Chloroflexota bacterium]MCY3583035.1 ABC transporter permease [Chloroflexota bacterium]MCY3714958.1 ABC transporter permease [Chloroflexota bacterium]MDE2650886.1 ABC transporter permease [Chloroflexota bacterium]MXV92648.1 ABC transporter permease [Chloroflexota bacterium]
MMQAYLENKRDASNIGTFVTFLTLGFAVLGVVIAYLVAFGWMPLGERANTLRSDINIVETIVVIASLIYALCCARTGIGLLQREKSSLRWSQWMLFITIMIGAAILLSVIIPVGLKFALLLGQDIDLRAIINNDPGVSDLAPLALSVGETLIGISLFLIALLSLLTLMVFIIPPLDVLRRIDGISMIVSPPRRLIMAILVVMAVGVICILIAGAFVVPLYPGMTTIRAADNHRLLAGLLFFLPGLLGYRFVRQVEEESDELRRAIALTPGKYIRSELAKSPSAGAIIGFIAIFMSFTMATDLFLEPSSVASFLSNVATKGIIAIGVTYLMISGEFDLSVGSILGVTALSFMNFMTHGAPVFGVMEPIPAALLAIFVAFILGAINGVLLITTRIPSFIVTLGTMLAFRAITLVAIAGGRILRYSDHHDALPVIGVSNLVFMALVVIGLGIVGFTAYRVLPVWYRQAARAWSIRENNGDFGTTTAIVRTGIFLLTLLVIIIAVVWLVAVFSYHSSAGGGQIVEIGYFGLFNGRVQSIGSEGDFFHMSIPRNANVRLAIVWWFIFVAIFHVILTNTSFGNSIFATGGNEGAARAQGVNVDRVKLQNFAIVAILTGIAAIYETARNPGVDPLKGEGWELEVIAMTVIGGALLTGGYGSVVGSLLGALIFGMLQTGLVLVGIESRLFAGTIGAIIIAAVVLNTLVRGAQRN